MTLQIESALEKATQRPMMTAEDFVNILNTRIELILLKENMGTDGLVVSGKSVDEQGNKKYILWINSDYDEEEQASVIAHEIAHIYYGLPAQVFGDEEYEKFIEDEEDRFVGLNKELVMRVFKTAHLANNVMRGHPFGIVE